MYKRLKKLRKSNNFNVPEVADLLGISLDQYLKYENGENKIPVKHLSILAKKYNTSIDYIVGDTDVMEPHRKDCQ